MAKIKVGDRFESNNYGWFEVIEYQRYDCITVKFDTTGYVTKTRSSQLKVGKVKDKLYLSVYGIVL